MPRRRILQGIGGAGAVSLAGCIGGLGQNDGDGTSTVYQGGSLQIAQAKSPSQFDPIVLNDVPSALVADRVFEGLYEYSEDASEHVPLLADGQPSVSNGGQTYEVTLKDGPTFQNGDPVTAEDVRYSFLAPAVEETENANEVVMIDTIDVVDDRTVRFNLEYPFAPFMHTLHRDVVPASVRGEMGFDGEGENRQLKDQASKEEFNTQNPIGSGPFQFEEWTEGDFVRISRWDDYWGEETANLAEVRYVPVTEPTTRVTTFRQGTNQIIQNIPPKLWSQVEGMGDANIQSVPGIGYFYLAFNCNEGPTTDPMVREAVDYVFSMDQAVSNFVEPAGIRQYSPLPAAVADAWDMPVDEWEQIPHDKDIAQAQQLFEEAGVPMDYDWTIIVPPDAKREAIGTTVLNGLKEAGFSNVQVQRYNWPKFLDTYITGNEGDYNMYTLGWAGVPDPDSFTYYLLGRTEDTLGVTNGTFWGNNSQAGKDAAEKFVQARESRDQEERRQLYEEGITSALEQRVHIPSYNLKNSYATKQTVHDFKAHAVANMELYSSYNNTWMEQ